MTAKAAASCPPASSGLPPQDLRIMVVDDEPDVLTIIQRSLRKWDFESDGFTDPSLALEHFRNYSTRYALVITDLRMDHISGYELIEQLLQIKPNIKVMVVTAYYKDILRIPKSIRRIFDDDGAVLQKPIGLHKICDGVKRPSSDKLSILLRKRQ